MACKCFTLLQKRKIIDTSNLLNSFLFRPMLIQNDFCIQNYIFVP